jgi:hypothetical protein
MIRFTPGRRLERPDVPPLTTDDAALHVLAREREHRDRRLARLLGGDALDRDRHDLARALLPLLARALLDLAHRGHRLALGLVDHLRAERLLGLGRREPRDPLERGAMLDRRVLELLAHQRELSVPIIQLLRTPVRLVDLAFDHQLLLGEALLLALDLVPPGANVLLVSRRSAPISSFASTRASRVRRSASRSASRITFCALLSALSACDLATARRITNPIATPSARARIPTTTGTIGSPPRS